MNNSSTRNILLVASILMMFSVSLFGQTASNRLLPIRMNDKAGFIDTTGRVIVKPQFNRTWDFADGWAPFEAKERNRGDEMVLGFANLAGQFQIKYNRASVYREGISIVADKNGVAFIDKTGALVMHPSKKFSYLADGFSDGLLRVQWDNCYPSCGIGYVDTSGNTVIGPRFRMAKDFHEGIAAVVETNSEEWFFIDKTGKPISNIRVSGWNVVTDFSDGLAGVKVGDKWGFIDHSGRFVIEPQFEAAYNFSEGLAAVRLGCLWGFIDKTGKFVIKPQFGHATEFSEGLAAVDPKSYDGKNCTAGSHGKLGYVNKEGTLVIEPQFDLAFKFDRGIAKIVVVNPKDENDLQYGYIDNSGKYIWKPTS